MLISIPPVKQLNTYIYGYVWSSVRLEHRGLGGCLSPPPPDAVKGSQRCSAPIFHFTAAWSSDADVFDALTPQTSSAESCHGTCMTPPPPPSPAMGARGSIHITDSVMWMSKHCWCSPGLDREEVHGEKCAWECGARSSEAAESAACLAGSWSTRWRSEGRVFKWRSGGSPAGRQPSSVLKRSFVPEDVRSFPGGHTGSP